MKSKGNINFNYTFISCSTWNSLIKHLFCIHLKLDILFSNSVVTLNL